MNVPQLKTLLVAGALLIAGGLMFAWARHDGHVSPRVQPAAPPPISEEFRMIEHANAPLDASAAITKRDLRFLGMRGYTVEVPGLELYPEVLTNRLMVRPIDGTSDVRWGGEYGRYQALARAYARDYNVALLAYYQGRGILPKR